MPWTSCPSLLFGASREATTDQDERVSPGNHFGGSGKLTSRFTQLHSRNSGQTVKCSDGQPSLARSASVTNGYLETFFQSRLRQAEDSRWEKHRRVPSDPGQQTLAACVPVGQRQGEATGVYRRDCGYRSGESMLIATCESETVSEPAVLAMLLIVTGSEWQEDPVQLTLVRTEMVPSRRFERPTCPLGGGRSIQLSYEGSGGIFAWIVTVARSASPQAPARIGASQRPAC